MSRLDSAVPFMSVPSQTEKKERIENSGTQRTKVFMANQTNQNGPFNLDAVEIGAVTTKPQINSNHQPVQKQNGSETM